MSTLVPFRCPTHGWLLDTFPTCRVYCAKCRKWLPQQEQKRPPKLTGMAGALRGRSRRNSADKTPSDQHQRDAISR